LRSRNATPANGGLAYKDARQPSGGHGRRAVAGRERLGWQIPAAQRRYPGPVAARRRVWGASTSVVGPRDLSPRAYRANRHPDASVRQKPAAHQRERQSNQADINEPPVIEAAVLYRVDLYNLPRGLRCLSRFSFSCVTDKFRAYRDQLRTDRTRHNVEVKVQEDFKDLGGTTVENDDA
jgi:hypothetical protein